MSDHIQFLRTSQSALAARPSVPMHRASVPWRLALFAALACVYYVGATRHAERVNRDKGPGDQSAYIRYAKEMARTHYQAIGDRNRMPLYPAFQSLFFPKEMEHAPQVKPPPPPTKPRGLFGGLINRLKTDDQKELEARENAIEEEFFRRGKRMNIRLSMVLLAILGVLFAWYLPPLASTTLTLVVAFGYFVFKAGYFQADLLYYSFQFLTFVVCCELLRRRSTRASLLLAASAGALAALAHLTKAAALPFVALFIGVYLANELLRFLLAWKRGNVGSTLPTILMRFAAAALMLACFLAVLWPYISTSKRVFGHYFYNVNSTFYVWYDNWDQASKGTKAHGDRVGWPNLPPEQIPGPRKYLRDHTIGQILSRIGRGFKDIFRESYNGFWFMKYAIAYVGFAIFVAARRSPSGATAIIRPQLAIVTFLVLYAATHLILIAFYAPISSSGTTRFLLAHAAPLLFVLAWWIARHHHPFPSESSGTGRPTPFHFHLFMLATLALDLPFSIWPRLMSTYSGF